MPEYTLRIRRYSPESGEAAYWDDFTIDLDGHRSVLDGILQARDREDGSIGIRCSCRAAICGSCGVRINGKPTLACHTHLDEAAETAPDGAIVVEPMGNMPVLKDLIVDMDAVHWTQDPARHAVAAARGRRRPSASTSCPPESMIDVTQSMACIQCGACVSDCLSMEVDPLFIGPAALAKAYRFVGDPRDGQQYERLKDLAEDPHGIYDCTHCFNCIEACPKGVAPMSQIMRLRRIAGADHGIDDRNNGHRHEQAFVKNIEKQRAPARGRPAARLLRRQVPPARRARADRLAAGDPRRRCGAARSRRRRRCCTRTRRRRRSSASSSRSTRRASATSSTSTSWAGRRGRDVERSPEPVKVAYWPGCVSRGFTPELHGSMAKVAPLLDIELVELDRAALLRRRRDRRAQPGARRHPERAHVRARPAGDRRRRRPDDEHLLDLPGRAERVPGAAGRQQRVPRARQRDAGEREPALREGHRQQALPVADGRGDRPRRDHARRSSGR